jgi:hypothetical protein
MGQFKPMVKMMTTEPTVELKLKKGGSVKKADGGMMAMPSAMSAMPSRGGMMPVARPKRPSMAARRAAMSGMKGMQGGMKDGGESKATHKAEMSKMKGLEKELKSHESKPASKGHKGLATGGIAKSTKPGGYATGGVVNGQGGYKKGGAIASVIPESVSAKGAEGYKNTKMVTAHPDNNSAPTGKVKLGNGGGYKKGGTVYDDDTEPGSSGGSRGDRVGAPGGDKRGGAITKGGATKKHYATGGAVNNSGHAVAMPAKKPSAPVSNDRQSGTFKKGGSVTPAQRKEQSYFKAENATAMKQAKAQSNLKYQDGGKVTDLSKGAYDKSIGPSESDMDMAKTIRSIPSKLMEGAKSLFTSKDKPSGSVTKTEKSVTVSPARKRGGAVKC